MKNQHLILIEKDLSKLKSLIGKASLDLGVTPEEHPLLRKAVDIIPDVVIDFALQGKIRALQIKTNDIILSLDRMGGAFSDFINCENRGDIIIDALNAVSFNTQAVVKTIEAYSKMVVGFSEKEVIERHQVSSREGEIIEEFYDKAFGLIRDIDLTKINYRRVEMLVNSLSTFREYLRSLKKISAKIVSSHDKKKVLTPDLAVMLGSACATISKVSDVLVGEMQSAVKVKVIVVPVEVQLEKL